MDLSWRQSTDNCKMRTGLNKCNNKIINNKKNFNNNKINK